MKYAPMNGKKKVVLFDEVHSLLGASQEALLKGLEEPPPHFHFISCTTNPEALKDTFKRRCHIYEVAPLTSSDIIIHIRKILAAEKIKDFPQEIIDKIIELSSGSLGIVLKNLDMVIDMGDDIERALETLKSAGTAEAEVVDICRTIVNFNMSDQARWNRVKKLLADFKGDGESARRPMLGWFTKCLLNSKMDGNGDAVAMIIEGFRKNFYDDGRSGLVAACYLACDTGEREEK
jgi:DNA polymerase III delta prime subunit